MTELLDLKAKLKGLGISKPEEYISTVGDIHLTHKTTSKELLERIAKHDLDPITSYIIANTIQGYSNQNIWPAVDKTIDLINKKKVDPHDDVGLDRLIRTFFHEPEHAMNAFKHIEKGDAPLRYIDDIASNIAEGKDPLDLPVFHEDGEGFVSRRFPEEVVERFTPIKKPVSGDGRVLDDMIHALKNSLDTIDKKITKQEILDYAPNRGPNTKKGKYKEFLGHMLNEENSKTKLNNLVKKLEQQKKDLKLGVKFDAEVGVTRVKGKINLILIPTKKDVKEAEEKARGFYSLHAPGGIAYARLKPNGNVLEIENLQSDPMAKRRLPSSLKKKYKKWQDVMLNKIEEFAKANGFQEIHLITANAQLRHWNRSGLGLGAVKAHETYTKLPKKHGYELISSPGFSPREGSFTEVKWGKRIKL